MAKNPANVVFEEVSSNPWASNVWTFTILIGLFIDQQVAAASEVSSSQVVTSPFVFYFMMIITGLVVVWRSNTSFTKLTKGLGFDADSYSGVREDMILLLLGLAGAGFAVVLYSLFAWQLLTVFPGSQFAAAFGLYPAAAAPLALTFASLGPAGSAAVMVVVAFVETAFVILVGKNYSNWLAVSYGWSESAATSAAFFILAPLAWGLTHYFSWNLSVWNLPVFLGMNAFFFLGYMLADISGVFSPDESLQIKDVLAPPAIMAHAVWNTLTVLNVVGSLSMNVAAFAGIGFATAVFSFALLYFVSRRTGSLQMVEI